MARFPGTEIPANRAGLRPGDSVRGSRCRANAERGLADRHGLVTEVRLDHACVLFDRGGETSWLANELLRPADGHGEAFLAQLGRVMQRLDGQRLERDEQEWIVHAGGFPAEALDAVREELGATLLECRVRPEGVHALAVCLRLNRS